MIKGEPVFQDGDEATHTGAPQEDHFADKPTTGLGDAMKTTVDSHGQKVIPEIAVHHVECHTSGDHLEVWVKVHNASNVRLFVDKIDAFGMRTEFDYDLAPGAERQLRVYRGPVLRNNSYQYADINYRSVEVGDYFQARFFVEYDYEHDGTYQPNDFNLQHPIRDI